MAKILYSYNIYSSHEKIYYVQKSFTAQTRQICIDLRIDSVDASVQCTPSTFIHQLRANVSLHHQHQQHISGIDDVDVEYTSRYRMLCNPYLYLSKITFVQFILLNTFHLQANLVGLRNSSFHIANITTIQVK